MFAASYVSDELARWKAEGVVRSVMIRNLAKLCLGWSYVFGAAGEMCTVGNRKSYAGNRPDYAASIRGVCPVLSDKQPACDGCQWVDTRIFDCRGFVRWLLSMVGVPLYGGTVTAQWEDSKNWVLKGDIKDMPRSLVCCVFRPSHTGMYTGDGWVRHCGGKKGQVVEEELPGSPRWERFGIPAGLYTNAELEAAGVKVDPAKNIPTLRKGNSGDEVAELQALLNAKCGSDLKVDGVFGAKTEAAVKAFQKANNLTVDGIVGPKTWSALGVQGDISAKPDSQDVWDTLYQAIKNPYGVAGLMGNLQAESGINPENLQNTGEKALGMTDRQYTEAVDDGSYTNFADDGFGYGISQWTYSSRKNSLLNYAKKACASIGDMSMQLSFLLDELRFEYSSVWYVLLNAASVREASDVFMLKYEKPKNVSEENQAKRAELGQAFFDKFAERLPIVKNNDFEQEIEELKARIAVLERRVDSLFDQI